MRNCEYEEWRCTVFEALKRVESVLDRPASFRDAAEGAGYSPYHFHRVFKRMTGESVADFGRRLRLEQAARMLRGTRISVSEIAIECGFDSLEAFCRTFRASYGASPTSFRRQRGPGTVLAASGRGILPWDCHLGVWMPLPLEGTTMTVHIVEIPPMRVLSMRIVGDYGRMPETWGRMMAYVDRHGLRHADMQMLSAFYDHSDEVPMETRRTDVCVTVPDGVEAPNEDVVVRTLPGGLYAIHTFRGDTEGIGPVWDRFRTSWFADAGWSIRPEVPSLEWYRAWGVGLEHHLTDLCDPVQPAEIPTRDEVIRSASNLHP